ncbi:long-chain-fatty-acid--CoA ligase [Gordonia McavH-238-E]|uniref:long-chain-fatty-acid--CoA ligase n=1 Tax=Gordonia sp. McavH-238-E TaxID=2917736 RepID=UPI001EF623CA|nr:long-chain-fatty-acid--CoA ligase [Gordonia sp. McavH-238-E]MCG7633269.1 long-chain-fatty-acid--CoA ligase [Gordonia sp. McavH-238-E]
MSAGRNHHTEPLTPLTFLRRSATVFGDRVAVIDGTRRWTYRELLDRASRQAGLLASMGVRTGDRVAVLAPNTHIMLESHFGVPFAGAVIVTLNIRLDADELARIVDHAGCSLILCDPTLADTAEQVRAVARTETAVLAADEDYEAALAGAEPRMNMPDDEGSMLSLNYTSGTTGAPKGVIYQHRGAYLQSLAVNSHFGVTPSSVYLWTLPMFHCNGWCLPWAITAAGGTHVCLPAVRPADVWSAIGEHEVTHLCAAPTVLTSLCTDPAATRSDGRPLYVAVGGAPPAPALISRAADLGMSITHLYGLTETYGPLAICEWRREWDGLPAEEQARLRSRQGVGNVIAERIRVVDEAGADVPADGTTVGEVAVRGNNVMLGYYRDEAATAEAVPDGWFRTGDLAVMHPDNYLEIRDRLKDIIISGGENISSIEVESAIMANPDVLEAAVIAVPHDHWGERPVAVVTVGAGATVDSDQIRAWLRGRLAGFKIPDHVAIVDELPMTASGKIRKAELRVRRADAD